MSQKEVFLAGEGAAWMRRNKNKVGKKPDPVIEAIENYKLDPGVVLEVGCANGWRLDLIKSKFDCDVFGVDPSIDGPGAHYITRGTADRLHFRRIFDVIIYGWCLYLCDPEDYFKIAMCGDNVLTDGGFLIVYDFYNYKPYKVKYKHKKGLFSYHYDFSKLWLAHPHYSLYGRTIQDETCVTILKKNVKNAFPEEK